MFSSGVWKVSLFSRYEKGLFIEKGDFYLEKLPSTDELIEFTSREALFIPNKRYSNIPN